MAALGRTYSARVALLLLLVGLVALQPSLVQARLTGQGNGPNRVGLVVRHGDGRVVTDCIAFAETTITGEDLLYRAELDVAIAPFGNGGAICRLDGEGCTPPGEDCFCKCRDTGAACAYWVYAYLAADGRWQNAGNAASAQVVGDGDVEGWSWGGEPLPSLSFTDVCAPQAANTRASPPASPAATATAAQPAPTAYTPVPPPADEASPSWAGYASFALLGLVLVGALGWWLLRRQGV
jgi:hypothetical protein